MSRPPMFISVEGIEGVGKTTHLPFIAEQLRARGREVMQTREPGGTPLGESIRTLLLDNANAGMNEDAELLLVFAARAQHLDKVIRPALAVGIDVLCDRFTDATYAYQGGGRGIGIERIAAMETFVQKSLRPHLTIIFDAPPEIACARAKQRSASDRFEAENVEFFTRVREVYLQRAAREPGRYQVIDASKSIETVRGHLASLFANMFF
ncbi:MAG: dTMP kinase [Gammaproteobacteria bacterium]